MTGNVVVAVDVGTASTRAAIFTLAGERLAHASRPISVHRWHSDFAEQSSGEIWQSICESVRSAIASCGPVTPIGIGFDATCSLVVLDRNGQPLSVTPDGPSSRNVIVWMDHRAQGEADEINAGRHTVLDYVGGLISLEMQTPKLLWLKRNHPGTWARAAHFFDLPDFLTYRATGSTSRSLCSLVCKWTYLAHAEGWNENYFRSIGLDDLADEGFRRIGTSVMPIGSSIGKLSSEAAGELGVPAGIAVATSVIDAHAGGIGVLGGAIEGEPSANFQQRLALIGGTSSCHMAVSPSPTFVPGVWGPYFSAMLPGFWLNEGGQSATGALIDHIIAGHARAPELMAEAASRNTTIYALLNAELALLADQRDLPVAELTRDLHMLGDFHGNRSPLADATVRGMVSGLSLSNERVDLALIYLAAIQAIAYGTRMIVESVNGSGFAIDTLLACGGGTKNPLFLKEHADATNTRVALSSEPEAVLMGTAILAATAAGAFGDVLSGMKQMSRVAEMITPDPAARRFHDAKYAVFRKMYEDQKSYRALMAS